VDWDFSFAYILEYPDVLCGNEGGFTGQKMGLKKFANGFKQARLDIVDETYGYNTSKFDGYLSAAGSLKECRVEIYHLGAMSYIIKD
jgi:hypothetical protein